ncbi:eukaryotic translation initiation factor 3 subunit A [Elysia marginata]|uniref:Eukaryotic translation initiation factor 3 subunit A n=1 Tax=Elysia marginata TaxID=1093978 RepID=A0AAV4JLJ8_9GAST|nr:eukaryotic translation initiation factor 3 subunit A [Elysia marginata]
MLWLSSELVFSPRQKMKMLSGSQPETLILKFHHMKNSALKNASRGCYRSRGVRRGCYKSKGVRRDCYKSRGVRRGCYKSRRMRRGCYKSRGVCRGCYKSRGVRRGCYKSRGVRRDTHFYCPSCPSQYERFHAISWNNFFGVVSCSIYIGLGEIFERLMGFKS